MRGQLGFRAVLACTALLLAGGALLIDAPGWRGAPKAVSLLAFLVWMACLTGSVLLLGMAVAASETRLARWRDRLNAFERALQNVPPPAPLPGRIALGLLGAVAAMYAAGAALSMLSAPDVNTDDQNAYMQLTEVFRRKGVLNGGALGYIASEDYVEANRHPLYPLLMSALPVTRYPRALNAKAKMFRTATAFLGFAVLLATALLAAGSVRWRTAVLGAGLLAVNGSFLGYSVTIVCEVLLMLWVGLAFWLLHRETRSLYDAWGTALLVGLCLGLAFFTKGTGLVYLLVFLLWVLVGGPSAAARPLQLSDENDDGRRDAGKPEDGPVAVVSSETEGDGGSRLKPPCAPDEDAVGLAPRPAPGRRLAVAILICCGFIFGASPLLKRNVHVFGNPFYNHNSLLLFASSQDEYDVLVGAQTTVGSAARNYLTKHSWSDVFRREANGIVWQAFIMLRALGPAGLDDGRVLFGAPLALLALLGLRADRRPAARLLVWWIVSGWVVFAWYVPIAAGDRFMIPLLPPVLMYAADGLGRVLGWIRSRRRQNVAAAV